MHALNLPYPQFCQAFSPQNFMASALTAILYTFMTQPCTTLTHRLPSLHMATVLGHQLLVQKLLSQKWGRYEVRAVFSARLCIG